MEHTRRSTGKPGLVTHCEAEETVGGGGGGGGGGGARLKAM